ncbi:MAG TPA: hypothetical protein VHY48_01045 [Acidobacteriaceae bacterium]|jgi:hypothetical protein|nr:hypothetical protein [Acidobacteriaceae bacterium]
MPDAPRNPVSLASRFTQFVGLALLSISAVFLCLHFLHLTADFPNNSPWMDWSKYTDEGWYGDAAIRHFLTGHWYWAGDFNPAVALPVWPAIELVVFKFTGVSPSAARALTLCVFALTLVIFYLLLQHSARSLHPGTRPLAGPLCVLFLCLSPYLYVFERMAILEPLLISLAALALLVASHMRAEIPASRSRTILLWIALGILLPAMVLTKTTAICLFPAVFYMIWSRAGYRIRAFVRLALPPSALGLALWLTYFFGFVHPHYLEDYRYLFSANAYTGFELDPLATVVLDTIKDGAWMGHVLYPTFFIVVVLALFWRPRLFTDPLFPSLLLWAGGYFAFLTYHNNLQPRYYLVIAVPVTAAVALALDNFREVHGRAATLIVSSIVAAVVLAIAVPDALLQLDFILHPTYQFEAAAQAIKRIVLADPTHSHLILSISGSDITLMTGLPSIDDDFGTLDLDQRVAKYHPGWYVAWNELDDDKAADITPLYRPVRVAAFPALDDPDRNLLIVYRLDPKQQTTYVRSRHHPIPAQLQTKLGEQPTTTQLKH